jgi:hypothetical protein
MAPNLPTVRDDRRRRPGARRRLGFSVVISATSVAAGGGYLATARLTHLGRIMHLSLPHDALFSLIITVGIVIIVLGWRVIVYFERRDRHRHEIISGMQNQEGVYQKYEDSTSTYERWPTAAATQSEQSLRQPRAPRPPRAETNGHADVGPLDHHQQIIPGTRPEGGIADPGPGQPGSVGDGRSPVVRAVTDPPPAAPRLPPQPGAGRARSRRRRR